MSELPQSPQHETRELRDLIGKIGAKLDNVPISLKLLRVLAGWKWKETDRKMKIIIRELFVVLKDQN